MKRFFLLFLVLALAVACSPKTTPAGKSGKSYRRKRYTQKQLKKP